LHNLVKNTRQKKASGTDHINLSDSNMNVAWVNSWMKPLQRQYTTVACDIDAVTRCTSQVIAYGFLCFRVTMHQMNGGVFSQP